MEKRLRPHAVTCITSVSVENRWSGCVQGCRAARQMICKAVFEEAESSLSRLPSPNKQYWHRDASRSPRPLTRHQPNSATERAQWPRRPAHPPKDDRRRPSFQAIALQPLSRQAQCSHGDENAIGVWHYWGFHRWTEAKNWIARKSKLGSNPRFHAGQQSPM